MILAIPPGSPIGLLLTIRARRSWCERVALCDYLFGKWQNSNIITVPIESFLFAKGRGWRRQRDRTRGRSRKRLRGGHGCDRIVLRLDSPAANQGTNGRHRPLPGSPSRPLGARELPSRQKGPQFKDAHSPHN